MNSKSSKHELLASTSRTRSSQPAATSRIPSFRMERAALMSRSWCVPHFGQRHLSAAAWKRIFHRRKPGAQRLESSGARQWLTAGGVGHGCVRFDQAPTSGVSRVGSLETMRRTSQRPGPASCWRSVSGMQSGWWCRAPERSRAPAWHPERHRAASRSIARSLRPREVWPSPGPSRQRAHRRLSARWRRAHPPRQRRHGEPHRWHA